MLYCFGLCLHSLLRYGQYSIVIAQSYLKLCDEFPKRKSYIYSTKLQHLKYIGYFKFQEIYIGNIVILKVKIYYLKVLAFGIVAKKYEQNSKIVVWIWMRMICVPL